MTGWYRFKHWFWTLFTPQKRHYYLDKAKIESYPDNNFGGSYDFKDMRSAWRQKRKARKYGFAPRDCWDLDTTFYLWLYEHLCCLLDDTNTDLTCRKFHRNGREYTEGEYIQYLKQLCLDMIKFDEFKGCPDLKMRTVPDDEHSGSFTVVFDNPQEELDFHHKKWAENIKEQDTLRKEICNVFCELLPHLWW